SEMQRLGLLRAYSLTFDRFGRPSAEAVEAVLAQIDPLLTGGEGDVQIEALKLAVYLRAPNAATIGMEMLAARREGRPVSWSGVEQMNDRYGAPLKMMMESPPPTDGIEIAYLLRNVENGWTPQLRREYFTFLNEAGKANGGASYPGYLKNIRDEALTTCSNEERTALTDITGEDFNPTPDFPIVPPAGPGRKWTLEGALETVEKSNPKNVDFERGRSLFHAVQCGACHRFAGLGGGVGPDLTSVPNKFDRKYLIEAIIHPSKNISDQYQSSTVLLANGQVVTGLAVEQGETVFIYSEDPAVEPQRVSKDDVLDMEPSDISQMPTALLDKLNPAELRSLTAYIMSGGNRNHKIYGRRR
ncbi:MAG: c-type cytochrome, partial [Planctomycetota bacterium]